MNILRFINDEKAVNQIGNKVLKFVISDYLFCHYPKFTPILSSKILKILTIKNHETTKEIGKTYLKFGLKNVKEYITKEIISKENNIEKVLTFKSPQKILKKLIKLGTLIYY